MDMTFRPKQPKASARSETVSALEMLSRQNLVEGKRSKEDFWPHRVTITTLYDCMLVRHPPVKNIARIQQKIFFSGPVVYA